MIDVGLLILMVILGVVAYVMGWISCRLFHVINKDAEEIVHPCETLKDITRRDS